MTSSRDVPKCRTPCTPTTYGYRAMSKSGVGAVGLSQATPHITSPNAKTALRYVMIQMTDGGRGWGIAMMYRHPSQTCQLLPLDHAQFSNIGHPPRNERHGQQRHDPSEQGRRDGAQQACRDATLEISQLIRAADEDRIH